MNKPKCLIICPASLKANWAREVFKWTGHSCKILSGSIPDKSDIAEMIRGDSRYYIINYDLIGADVEDTFLWVEIINLCNFTCIIADEIHYGKNTDSKRSRALMQLTAQHKIGLSGTLLVNRPRELWPAIRFVDKKLAGSYESFLRFYESGKSVKNLDHLQTTLNKVMIRRTKKDVLSELPPINRITREYELTTQGNKIYNLALQGLFKALDEWKDEGDTKAIASILEQLLRLKQICAKDKIDYIADLAIEIYDNSTDVNKKVLIFTQFVSSPPIVSEIAKRLGQEVLTITGEQDPTDRLKIVDQFQSDDSVKFLVCSIRAAGEGLNITAAGNVIFSDLTWTPKDHLQAEGRAYARLSDLHSINSYYVISSDTVETEIMNLIQQKMKLIQRVMDGDTSHGDSGSIAMDLIKVLKAERIAKKR